MDPRHRHCECLDADNWRHRHPESEEAPEEDYGMRATLRASAPPQKTGSRQARRQPRRDQSSR